MSHLKRYRLPDFTLTVSEPTPAERATIERSRDALTVAIKHRSGDLITMTIGSPLCGEWDEDRAARSAISFAYAAYIDTEDTNDYKWSKAHGEELTNQAFNHGILGRELRQ